MRRPASPILLGAFRPNAIPPGRPERASVAPDPGVQSVTGNIPRQYPQQPGTAGAAHQKTHRLQALTIVGVQFSGPIRLSRRQSASYRSRETLIQDLRRRPDRIALPAGPHRVSRKPPTGTGRQRRRTLAVPVIEQRRVRPLATSSTYRPAGNELNRSVREKRNQGNHRNQRKQSDLQAQPDADLQRHHGQQADQPAPVVGHKGQQRRQTLDPEHNKGHRLHEPVPAAPPAGELADKRLADAATWKWRCPIPTIAGPSSTRPP